MYMLMNIWIYLILLFSILIVFLLTVDDPNILNMTDGYILSKCTRTMVIAMISERKLASKTKFFIWLM